MISVSVSEKFDQGSCLYGHGTKKMERSSGNFDTAVVERAEVVQVRKQRTECRDF